MMSRIKERTPLIIGLSLSFCIIFTFYQMFFMMNGFDIFTAWVRIILFVVIAKLLYEEHKKGKTMKFKAKDNKEEQVPKAETQSLIVPQVTPTMDSFLKNKDISTYRDKLQVLAEFENQTEQQNNISDDDYKALFGAILLGDWGVKGFYINVAKPLGKAMYLSDTGNGFDFVKYREQATLFDETTVKNVLPIYQTEDFREDIK